MRLWYLVAVLLALAVAAFLLLPSTKPPEYPPMHSATNVQVTVAFLLAAGVVAFVAIVRGGRAR